MKIIEPGFNFVYEPDGEAILRTLELAGRTAYKSEARITDDSAADFVRMVIRRGHTSVLEHAVVAVRIVCDRGVSHEIVRHRIGVAYTQESTRFCNYGNDDDGITVINPSWLENDLNAEEWKAAMSDAEHHYLMLLERGWSPQQARSVLPNSLKTEIVCTFTLRAWRHFFSLRCAKAAHPQMRQIALPLLEAMAAAVPAVFEDQVKLFLR